jgi:aspartate carbamoyltransferase catalytic subunit
MELIEHERLEEVVSTIDVLYVTRIQRERFPDAASYFSVASSYRITPELLAGSRKHAIVLHPLPRVDEIDPRVDKCPQAKYFEQSKNGVPVRMAMLQKVVS